MADIIRAQQRQKVSPSRQIRRKIVGDPRNQKKLIETHLKTDIRRYLAADSAARRLKLDTETGTQQSSVQSAGPPLGRFGRHTRDPAPSDRFEEKTFGDIWEQTVKQTS